MDILSKNYYILYKISQHTTIYSGILALAEGEGFEPPDPCRSSVFKTDAIDHSANLPCNCLTAYDILSKNRAFVNRLVLPRHGVGVFLDKTVRFGYTLQNQMPAGRGHKRRVQ